MSARPRTTFDKLQRERARQEKQAAKRARRQGTPVEGQPYDTRDPETRGDEPELTETGPVDRAADATTHVMDPSAPA